MPIELVADTAPLAPSLVCGVFICDAAGQMSAANATLMNWLDLDPASADVGSPLARMLPSSAAAPEDADAASWRLALGRGLPYAGTCRCRLDSGRTITMLVSVAPTADRPGQFLGVALLQSDTEPVPGNAWYAAHHDATTGLPNQTLLEERLDLRLAALRRRGGELFVLVVHVRDSGRMGRSGGVPGWITSLQATAARLRAVAGPHGIAARLGGGEFFLALEASHPPDTTALLGTLTEPLRIGEQVIRPQVALGVYHHTALDGAAASDLVHRASLAATEALATGGSCARHYSRSLQEAMHERWEMTRDLARAVHAGELELVFQPELDLRDLRVVAMETLVRWRCARRGPVSPAVFIPLAEEAGLIAPLGSWVLEQACRFARQLDVRYRDAPRVAVNVSPLQLRGQTDFAEQVAEVLQRTGLDPARLELEITEGVLVDESLDAAALFDRLNALGVKLAIDDFGTGYSSLSYLARFPLSRLKIDRAFVKDLPGDARALAIVKAILGMANGLGMEVTAEGIENDEQARLLESLGCGLGQGFGLMKPMPPDSVRALLAPRYPAT